MFGNAPRPMWERWIAPDRRNRIPLATRCLLVREPDGRNVLLEAGVGAFFEPFDRERYGVVEDRHVLLDRLAEVGLAPSDVHVVVLSHLHFDHAGGVLAPWSPDDGLSLVFPEARYVVSRAAWQRALEPTPRDRASFVPGLCELLVGTGRLELVDGDRSETLGDGYRFHHSDGHTPGLLMTEVDTPAGPLVYASDLVPGVPWVHLPITMGYDRFPELVVEEKTRLIADWAARGVRPVFVHDPLVALATLTRDERGRWGVVDPVADPVAGRPGPGRGRGQAREMR
ncbi:MAG: MBL fold metallo-hydrolase [Microthrixaceae bacterium]